MKATTKPAKPAFARVPRLWPNGTIACLATGPSLTQADVDTVRGRVDAVIAINDAYKLAPWADVLYACDYKWWRWHKGVPSFPGVKYTLARDAARLWPAIHLLRRLNDDGWTTDPTGLTTGSNSGYQAIILATHFGATRVILLGYDMKGVHFFGKHPDQSKPPFALCLKKFKTLATPLKQAGVQVMNCTRTTALDCFPTMDLRAALEQAA